MSCFDVLTHNLQFCKTDIESIRNISVTLATYINSIQNILQETSEKLLSPKEDQCNMFLSELIEIFDKFSNFLQDLSQENDCLLDLTQTIDARHNQMLKSLTDCSDHFSKDKLNNSRVLNTSNDTKQVKDHEIKSLPEVFEKGDLKKFTVEINKGYQDENMDKNSDIQEGKKLIGVECLDSCSTNDVKSSEEIKKGKAIGEIKVEAMDECSNEEMCETKIATNEEIQKYPSVQEIKAEAMDEFSNEEIQKYPLVREIKVEATEEYFDEQLVSNEEQCDSFSNSPKSTAQTANLQGRVVCDICGKDYSSMKYMKIHRKIHTEGKHVCTICGTAFTRKANLNMHEKTHSEALNFKCSTCPRAFPHKTMLDMHARGHRGKEVCNQCGKNFSKVDHLKLHMYSHTPDRKLPCHICNKLFERTMTLNAHLKLHANERKYKCRHCGKGFNQSGNLITHERIHTGERRYKCMHCEKAFVKKENLTRHERIHTGEKPYGCEFCDMKFSSSSHKNRHLKTHKDNENNTSSETVAE